MKSVMIVLTVFFLAPAFAHAQQTSIAHPTATMQDTANKPDQTKPDQKTAKPRKTTEERFQACMERHQAKERVARRTGERCRNLAARKG
jgi:biopolymer transport protein ExbD